MRRGDLPDLLLFVTVARRRSFRGAARDLGIAPSAVSQRIARLETALGRRLLVRSTRSVALTEEGQSFLQRLEPAFEEIAAAWREQSERDGEPSGLLRLSVPDSAADLLIMPRVAAFTAAYPGVALELRIEAGLIDIVADGCDAGVRLGESLQPDMIAVPLGPMQRGLVVGAPAYLDVAGRPDHPRDLARHRCIVRRFPGGRLYRWELEKDGEALEVEVKGPLILDGDRLILQAALDGVGLAYLFEQRVAGLIAAGRLCGVLEDWCPSFPGFFLYYPGRRTIRPALRAFIDFFCRREARNSRRGGTVPGIDHDDV